jgi:DNA anti-recombination protein RmuC
MAEQEAEGRPPAQEVVGRTTSDAVTEITREVLRLLGRAAPTVVFLAMVVFGVYKFFELQNEKLDAVREARLEAQAENLATITALKDTVLRDASALSQLQQSNVQVINEQLAQHQSILRSITENQQRVAELTREEAERSTELEAQAAELAALRETLDAATRKLAASAEEEKPCSSASTISR